MISGEQADEVLKILKDDATRTYDNYEKMLNERYDGTTIDENKAGLARELARMNLTLNSYTMVLENRFIKFIKLFIFKSR